MKKSCSKYYYHAIWLTQNGQPLITPAHRDTVKQAITNEFVAINCELIKTAILSDHVHCLFGYNGAEGLPAIYKKVKRATAYQINSNRLMKIPLYWDKGYNSYSISHNNLNHVIEYLNLAALFCATNHLYFTLIVPLLNES